MARAELNPENIKNPKYVGIFTNRVNGEAFMADMQLRFATLKLVAEHNLILAATIVSACFLPQIKERNYLLDLSEERIHNYEEPEKSAAAFVALSKLGERNLLAEQYHIIKGQPKQIKEKLAPCYLELLKYNGLAAEQQILFTMLINLATTEAQAVSFFEVMQLQHIPANLYAYNSVLNKTESWEQTQFWLIKAYNDGFPPDVVTYSILLNLAPDFATAQILFQEMKEKGIKGDSVSYNTFLNKCVSYEQAEKVFMEMQRLGIKGDSVSYNTFLNKCVSYEQAEKVFMEMQRLGIKGDSVSYSTFLNKCVSYEQAEKVFNQMLAAKLRHNFYTFGAFVRKCENKAQFFYVLQQVREARKVPDDKTNSFIVRKAEHLRVGGEEISEYFNMESQDYWRDYWGKLSGRLANKRTIAKSGEKQKTALQIGDKVKAVVIGFNKNNTAAYCVIGDEKANLHKSQLSWRSYDLRGELLMGDEIEAYILEINSYGINLTMQEAKK
jgi:Pentatricopeptide repeat domain